MCKNINNPMKNIEKDVIHNILLIFFFFCLFYLSLPNVYASDNASEPESKKAAQKSDQNSDNIKLAVDSESIKEELEKKTTSPGNGNDKEDNS